MILLFKKGKINVFTAVLRIEYMILLFVRFSKINLVYYPINSTLFILIKFYLIFNLCYL